MLFKTTGTSTHNKSYLLLYSTKLGSHIPSSNTGILSSCQHDTYSCSDFTEWFDQRPHFCITGFDSFLSVPQLWGQAGPDRHTHQDVSAEVVVPHTAMNLTTDETRQFLFLSGQMKTTSICIVFSIFYFLKFYLVSAHHLILGPRPWYIRTFSSPQYQLVFCSFNCHP